jgi:AbrB family looped-hinge helix DNA binding protein
MTNTKKRQGAKRRDRTTGKPHQQQGFAERETPWQASLPERIKVKVGPGGRIVIPAVYRSAMEVREGETLMLRVDENGELHAITPMKSVRLAQKMVQETIPGTDSLADSLIEDRRREFEKEFGDGSRRS